MSLYLPKQGIQMGQEDCDIHNKPAANTPEDSTRRCIYQSKANKMGQEDCIIYDKPTANTSEDNSYRDVFQTKPIKMGQQDCNVYDKQPGNIPDGREKNRKYRDKAGFREAQIDSSLEKGK